MDVCCPKFFAMSRRRFVFTHASVFQTTRLLHRADGLFGDDGWQRSMASLQTTKAKMQKPSRDGFGSLLAIGNALNETSWRVLFFFFSLGTKRYQDMHHHCHDHQNH